MDKIHGMIRSSVRGLQFAAAYGFLVQKWEMASWFFLAGLIMATIDDIMIFWERQHLVAMLATGIKLSPEARREWVIELKEMLREEYDEIIAKDPKTRKDICDGPRL